MVGCGVGDELAVGVFFLLSFSAQEAQLVPCWYYGNGGFLLVTRPPARPPTPLRIEGGASGLLRAPPQLGAACVCGVADEEEELKALRTVLDSSRHSSSLSTPPCHDGQSPGWQVGTHPHRHPPLIRMAGHDAAERASRPGLVCRMAAA